MKYEQELAAGIAAVRAAALVCRAVQASLVSAATLEKKDKSPVTVADFASQAIVCAGLQAQFPNDPVVGEEDAADLRDPRQAELLAQVVHYAGKGVGAEVAPNQALAWIDAGNGDASESRYWTLDPIDGTKGFLRGEQYAIALALIEDGEVVVGILGCPNMQANGQLGALFSATSSSRSRSNALFDAADPSAEIHVGRIEATAQARFCESVESGHSNQDEAAQIAAVLGIEAEPFRIDSQCKYASVARDDASIYLRLPTRADYQEKIWDHAAGKLIVEAAGGRVTDIHGQSLDFSRGRLLAANQGVVATCGSIHDQVIRAIKEVRG